MAVEAANAVTITGKTTENENIMFKVILSFYLESDRFTPADSLEFTVIDDIGSKKLASVQMYVDGSLIFGGIVDVQNRTIGQKGCFTSFVCRSKSCLMLDNEVKPYRYITLSSEELVRNHALRYGVKRAELPYFTTVPVVLANKGSSHWAFIELYCKLAYQKSPYLNRDGVLSCKAFNDRLYRFSNKDSSAIRFLEAQIINDRYNMISKLYVKTGKDDSGGTYQYTVNNKAAQSYGVVRERYYHPGHEWENNVTVSAKAYLEERQMDYFEIRLTVAGIYDIQVGDSAEFYDGGGWYQNLYVSQVRQSCDSSGKTTSLKLWNKRALLDA